MIEEEIWKPIKDNELYEVSNTGKARNSYTGRILKPGHNQSGHLQVVINGHSILLHKLVADAFMPNDNPLLKSIKHIDGNNENCCVDNLKRVTRSEIAKNRKYTDKNYVIRRIRALLGTMSDDEVSQLALTLIKDHSLYLKF